MGNKDISKNFGRYDVMTCWQGLLSVIIIEEIMHAAI